VGKKKLTPAEKRAKFHPLQIYEDYQKAVWFLLGALTVVFAQITLKILFG